MRLFGLLFHEHDWREYYHMHDGAKLKTYVRCDGCASEDILVSYPPPPKAPARLRPDMVRKG